MFKHVYRLRAVVHLMKSDLSTYGYSILEMISEEHGIHSTTLDQLHTSSVFASFVMIHVIK